MEAQLDLPHVLAQLSAKVFLFPRAPHSSFTAHLAHEPDHSSDTLEHWLGHGVEGAGVGVEGAAAGCGTLASVPSQKRC